MSTTKERIIGAALDLATERGLSEVTMIDIARTAGIARATLYNHYADVPSIFADAAARHNDRAITGLRQSLAVVASPTETIEQLVRYVATISAHGHTLTTHHALPPDVRHRLSAFDDELERQIADTLAAGTTTGEFRSDLDPSTTTTIVRHMLIGISELIAQGSHRAADIVRHGTDTVLAAITTTRDN